MPIYEYKCKKCEDIFDFLCLSSNCQEKIICPSCGGERVEKQLSIFSTGSPVSDHSADHNGSSCGDTGGFS